MKKSKSFWLSLVIFSLVGQIAWVMENMYLNIFIYERFAASASDISLMVGASSVSATLTTLFIGALSDKLGKRKLFICLGYLCWGVSIWSFAVINVFAPRAGAMAASAGIGVMLVVALDCVMTFFGSAANDAAFNAWLTDSTTSKNRGAAEGINSMMPMLAILAVFGGAMLLDPASPNYWNIIFGVIGTVVFILGGLGFFIIKEPKIQPCRNSKYISGLIYGFRPSVIKENSRLYFTLIAYGIFGISIQIFMPYLILYYTQGLGMDNYVLVFAPAIVLSAVFTAFYGRRFDKKSFSATVVPSLALLMAGYVILYFSKAVMPVFLGTLIMLCGYLSGMAVFGAMLRANTPENRAGMFQGQRIIAQVLVPGIIGPAIGAFLLRNAEKITNADGTVSFIPNHIIFLGALIASLAVWVAILPLFGKDEKKK